MSRTTIDLDDALVAEVMRRFDVSTKKDAVDLAVRRLAGSPVSAEFLLGLGDMGRDGDLDAMRDGAGPRT